MSALAGPEDCLDRVRRRLALHALWRSGLLFLPPLFAAWYIVFFLYRFAWLDADAVMISGAALLIAAAAFTAARFRARAPSPLAAARLIDETAAAEDRFVTLATAETAAAPAEFFSQLKSEAAALARMIDVKRDFPFRIERAIVNSIIAALAAVLVFQLVFELAPGFRPTLPRETLAAAAQKLAHDPRFADLAAAMSAAAAKLDDPSLSQNEQRAILGDMRDKLDRRIALEKFHGGDVSAADKTADEIRQQAKKLDESS